MDSVLLLTHYVGLFLVASRVLCDARRSDEERLMGYLFDVYNPSARPVLDSSKTVHVDLHLSLLRIQDLHVRNQILSTTALLILEWTDERLRWSRLEFNVTEIVIEATKIWVPEFALINGAENIYGGYRYFRALVSSEGLVHWEPGGIFKTMCGIDITYFPFDKQRCMLKFGSWTYHTHKMNLTTNVKEVNLDSYTQNGEWTIMTTSAHRGEFAYDCCPNERFSFIEFYVYIRRRYTFYVMNVILPSIVTSVLLLSVFFCPPNQKVQIGVVVLLSFKIFLLNVADTIPKTSDHIPLLGIYLTCTMSITTLSMILTVAVLNFHYISDRPVPPWMQQVVLHYIARIVCVSTNKNRSKREQMDAASSKKTSPNFDAFLPGLASTRSSREMRDGESFPLTPQGRMVNKCSTTETVLTNSGVTKLKHDQNHPHGSEDSNASVDYSKDWQNLAYVFDRLFFWVFLLMFIIASFILFHPLIHPALSAKLV